MTDDRFDDGFDDVEDALRRELRSVSAPVDASRAGEMIETATRARLLGPRRSYAPLAAAAAVVLVGGGVAVFAGTAGGGGGEPAGGPAPSSSVTPTGAPRDMQTCDPGGAAYCSTLQVCLDLGAQAATPLPSAWASSAPLPSDTRERARRQARRRAVRLERRAEQAARSAALRREARAARARGLPSDPCSPLPRAAAGTAGAVVGTDLPRSVATRSLAVEPNASSSAGK